jgi:hypothetical protein
MPSGHRKLIFLDLWNAQRAGHDTVGLNPIQLLPLSPIRVPLAVDR